MTVISVALDGVSWRKSAFQIKVYLFRVGGSAGRQNCPFDVEGTKLSLLFFLHISTQREPLIKPPVRYGSTRRCPVTQRIKDLKEGVDLPGLCFHTLRVVFLRGSRKR